MADESQSTVREPKWARYATEASTFVFAEVATADLARATTAWMRDSTMDDAVAMANQIGSKGLQFAAGNAFEFMEAARFNAAAARQHVDLEAVVTALRGAPTGPVDIQILGPGDDVVREVQAKLYAKTSEGLSELRQVKYEGMGRLVGSDQVGDYEGLLAKRLDGNPDGIYMPHYRDVDEHLQGELTHGGVSSGGTTRAAARDRAYELPGWVEEQRRAARVAEVGKAAASGALAAACTTAVIQAVISAVRDDDQPLSRTVTDIARASAIAGLQGGAMAGGARIVEFLLHDSGALTGLASTSAPVDVVRLTAGIARAGHAFATGASSYQEFQEACAEEAIRTATGWAYGVIGQTLIPVPVLGTLVGVVVGQAVAGATLEGLKLARAAAADTAIEQERLRYLEVEAVHAIRIIEEQRMRLKELQASEAAAHARVIMPLLVEVSASAISGDDATMLSGLMEMNTLLGRELEWSTSDEFNALMADPDWALDL